MFRSKVFRPFFFCVFSKFVPSFSLFPFRLFGGQTRYWRSPVLGNVSDDGFGHHTLRHFPFFFLQRECFGASF